MRDGGAARRGVPDEDDPLKLNRPRFALLKQVARYPLIGRPDEMFERSEAPRHLPGLAFLLLTRKFHHEFRDSFPGQSQITLDERRSDISRTKFRMT